MQMSPALPSLYASPRTYVDHRIVLNNNVPVIDNVGTAPPKGRSYTHLFPLPTTHEWRLCVLVVDICPEVLGDGHGRLLGLFDGLVDLCLGLLVELLPFSKMIARSEATSGRVE